MRQRRLRWTAAFVALGVLAAGCGGDDDESSSDDEETAEDSEFEGLSYDESAACGTEAYAGNLAGIEAVDESTVTFTLCNPDVAFPAKVAFSALGIFSEEQLEDPESMIEAPIGTGPYKLEAWERGSQIVLAQNEDYWDDAPSVPTVVFRWGEESAQRLVELQSGGVDGIDNVGTEDFETVEADSNLQLIERDPLNVFYLGFNVDKPPFDNEMLRQAIGYAIDRDRIVENFYPQGSQAADQFVPPGIPSYEDGAEGFTYDQAMARDLLTQAGYPNGVDLGVLSYRATVRGYLPQPPQVASDIRDQLAQVGITVALDEQEEGAYIDNANSGNLGFYMLGWGADFPDATNFWDFHFGSGASPQFGTGFEDLHDVLSEAGSTTDEAARNELYAEANSLLFQHAQALPIALRRLGRRLQGDSGGRARQPAVQRAVRGHVGRGPGPAGVDAERRALGPVLRRRDRRRGPAGVRADQRVAARLRGRWHGDGAGAGQRVRAQRGPHRVDLHAPRGRDLPRRQHVRRRRRRGELPHAVGRRRSAPRRPGGAVHLLRGPVRGLPQPTARRGLGQVRP